MRLHMDNHGLSVSTVARRANLSPAAVHHYVNGDMMPRPTRYPDLAAALGIQVDTFESWTKGEVLDQSFVDTVNETNRAMDDTVAELRGALLKIPPSRWPVVVEIVRQVARIA